MRKVLALASAAVLTVSVVAAAVDHEAPRLSRDEVVLAFAHQGIALDEPTWPAFGGTSTDTLGTSSPEIVKGSDGTILLERPLKNADFYVFVASTTALAEQYYDRLAARADAGYVRSSDRQRLGELGLIVHGDGD